MKNIRKSFMLILIAIGCIATAFAGCSTTKGFGKDVENLGESIQGD